MAADPLEPGIASLSRMLLAEETLDTALRRTAELAVAVIPSCDALGVTLADGGHVYTRISTDDVAEKVDAHQYLTDEGPCLEAMRSREVVKIPWMDDEARWPEFTAVARQQGVVSSLSVPLIVIDEAVGALNMYSRADRFVEGDEALGLALADQAAVTLANARTYHEARSLVTNLNMALESRDVIGQAKGIIMERERLTADEAFATLSKASQGRNRKLRDVAREVVETGSWDQD